MQINCHRRWLLVLLLLISTCLLVTYAKGGRGGGRGGSRGSSSRGSPRRPAPRATSRPAYRPSPRPAPAPKPSAPEQPVVVKQPASNPNYKETNPAQGSANRQPASNPNYKPDGGAPPAGPPPPYAPAGHPAPPAAGGPPPPYQPSAPGQRPPYPQQPGGYPAQPPAYPPSYPGQPAAGRPPAYPGQSAPYPVQPGQGGQPYPQQPGYPGGYPQQPGANRPYPVQPGQSGGYPQQPGMNRPYPVQPGVNYPGGGNRPYQQQPLGGNVWQPQSGRPAPAYMNYGGMPTGTNMYAQPHQKKGFMGSLMSMGHGSSKHGKQNKYSGLAMGGMAAGGLGAGLAGGMALGGMRNMGGGFGRTAAMYSIMPMSFMAARAGSSFFRPSLGFGMLPMFMMMPHFHHHHGYYHGHGMYPRYEHYYDVYSTDYIGKCQKPIKNNHTEIRCKSTFDDTKCDARCEEGYEFPLNITLISNKCWHVSGIWRPKKNFPACKPLCEDECMNGGECLRPGFCKCPAEFRGDRCQFRKLNFLDCDVRKITKGENNIGWVCSHTRNETSCKIRCKSPAEFESPAAEEYRCSPQGVWSPDSLPNCVVKEQKDAAAVI